MSTPSAPPAGANTKKTTIPVDPAGSTKPEFQEKLIKSFRIILTLFYGQFFANALYTNLLRGIPLMVDKPGTAFPIIKVILGTFMMAQTIFAMVAVWLKIWRLIFVSAITLIVLSIVCLILTIIDVVLKRERKDINNSELGGEVTELSVEFLMCVAAVVISFYMVRLLRDYQRVPNEEAPKK